MNCFTCGSNHMIETTTIYVEKLGKQAEKIISEVMLIDYNKAA